MYHHIGVRRNNMFRSAKSFTHDLERLDAMGFRPVTATEWLDDRMNLPPGASPVVMTFDDSHPDQLRLLKNGTLDPTCMMGVWQTFTKTHPEFPMKATFFVLPDLFGQRRFKGKKLKLISDWGCELANHSLTHPHLNKLSDDKVKKELAGAADKLAKLGVTLPSPMALPYGDPPRNRKLLKGFDWKGHHYSFSGVFYAGGNPTSSTHAKHFKSTVIARVECSPTRFGIKFWLDQVAKGKVKLYVQ
jgi:hypothetical protein